MRTHELKPPAGAHRSRKRVGRGVGSQGTYSGRGVKGQKARSGGGVPAWFEGGQMPLQRRLPKRGFNRSRFQVEVQIVNLADLARFPEQADFDRRELAGLGLVDADGGPVKLLGRGEIDRAVVIEVDAVSAGARRKVEAAGGSVRVREA